MMCSVNFFLGNLIFLLITSYSNYRVALYTFSLLMIVGLIIWYLVSYESYEWLSESEPERACAIINSICK